VIDRGHVFQPGEDPLAQWYMTPEQVAALVAEVRRTQGGITRAAAQARWNHAARQLAAEQVTALRRERAAGRGVRELGRQYGVSGATVLRIVRGERYRDVGGPVEIAPNG